jgi:hypothetical protein
MFESCSGNLPLKKGKILEIIEGDHFSEWIGEMNFEQRPSWKKRKK